MNRLSSREKTLLAIIAGLMFAVANGVLLSSLWEKNDALRAATASKQQEVAAMRAVLEGRELWEKRSDWLSQKQPMLINRDQAPVALLKQVKEAAVSSGVLLEQPNLGGIEVSEGLYQAVSISVETKSSWKALIAFANALLQPEEFIVFDSCALQIETADPTRMHGKFKISKWYAP